jgi:hypothetical protein
MPPVFVNSTKKFPIGRGKEFVEHGWANERPLLCAPIVRKKNAIDPIAEPPVKLLEKAELKLEHHLHKGFHPLRGLVKVFKEGGHTAEHPSPLDEVEVARDHHIPIPCLVEKGLNPLEIEGILGIGRAIVRPSGPIPEGMFHHSPHVFDLTPMPTASPIIVTG